jgi:hypothetical protein
MQSDVSFFCARASLTRLPGLPRAIVVQEGSVQCQNISEVRCCDCETRNLTLQPPIGLKEPRTVMRGFEGLVSRK